MAPNDREGMQGVFAAMVTPYDEHGSVNLSMVAKLTEYILDSGVDGIFPCGTTGEFPLLSKEERISITREVKAASGSHARVIANISSLDIRDIDLYIQEARKAGITDASIVAPSYYAFDQQAMIVYFQTVSRMATDMDLYLYNIPANAKNAISPAVLIEVMDTCSNVKGIKDSSMDFMVLTDYLRVSEQGFSVLTGNDAQVLPALQCGGAGALIASAGVYPKISKEIERFFKSKDIEAASKRQRFIYDFRSLCRSVLPVVTHKYVLEHLGFSMGRSRCPFRQLTSAEQRIVDMKLKELDRVSETFEL